jgi:glutamyl-tRNA synthetase
VIVKADGLPTYHLANVVDDHEMAITHVVRGEEWISSTPKHLLLYDWLGWERPAFAHMPLLRNTDKSKISKRKNPAARLMWFREQGYLPEALVNFLALMGYSQPDGEEIFTFDDMVASFDWARVNTVGPVFDLDKLGWLNGHYLRQLSVDDLAGRITEHLARRGVLPAQPTDEQRATVRAATPLVSERMQVLSEAEGMLAFLFVGDEDFAIDEDDAAKVLTGDAAPALEASVAALEPLPSWDRVAIEQALRAALVEGLGLKPKHAFGPVRVAATGRRVSPPLFESLELLGRERSLRRLRAGLALAQG